jgi:hypothetical protein
VLASALCAYSATATAQAADAEVTAAVFPTAAKDPSLAELAATLDGVVLAALGDVAHLKVTTRPPLDLPATQLALDCVGETNACMREVVERAATESLIAPSIERVSGELVMTLLHFDARGDGSLRSVARRHGGEEAERAALDALPSMVRELYGIAEPEGETAPPSPAPEMDPGPDDRALDKSYFPAAPVAITAAGVALVGAGAVFGLMMKATQDEFAKIVIEDEASAEAAGDKRDVARTQATLANVGFGVGAAVIAVGVAMWIVELSDDGEQHARIAPRFGPGEVGLAVSGRFGGTRR